MSSRSRPQTVSTGCEHGEMCVDDRDGHAITLMRLRLAHVDPDGWTDAVVGDHAPDGTVRLRRWSDGSPVTVWHHVPLIGLVAAGSPVSVHERYGVMAVGGHRLNVSLR